MNSTGVYMVPSGVAEMKGEKSIEILNTECCGNQRLFFSRLVREAEARCE
jgi:hypothetical protein